MLTGTFVKFTTVACDFDSLDVPTDYAVNTGAFPGGLSVLMLATLSEDLTRNKGVKAGKLTPEDKTELEHVASRGGLRHDCAASPDVRWHGRDLQRFGQVRGPAGPGCHLKAQLVKKFEDVERPRPFAEAFAALLGASAA